MGFGDDECNVCGWEKYDGECRSCAMIKIQTAFKLLVEAVNIYAARPTKIGSGKLRDLAYKMQEELDIEPDKNSVERLEKRFHGIKGTP